MFGISSIMMDFFQVWFLIYNHVGSVQKCKITFFSSRATDYS